MPWVTTWCARPATPTSGTLFRAASDLHINFYEELVSSRRS